MSASNLADLVRVARELSLAGEATLARLQEELDATRGQIDRLHRYGREYRAERGAVNASRSAAELRRRHVMIGQLDDQASFLSRTLDRHARDLDAARERQRRHRSSEAALRVLLARAREAERTVERKRELDDVDAACALRMGAERGAAHRSTGTDAAARTSRRSARDASSHAVRPERDTGP